MDLVRRAHAMREVAGRARSRGQRIGLVPTMGALHDGHRQLMRAAAERSDVVVVSVFVNPTQFDSATDLERYPQDLARDADVCLAEKVDYLFAPPEQDLYPPGPPTWVEVAGLSERIEGASRPGHFRGVTTVVLKLLHLVQPHVAVFGQKDAQQALIVRRMVRDLLLEVEIDVVPTVRDGDGLALSSRNVHLTPAERAAALAIPRALDAGRTAREAAGATPADIVEAVHRTLAAEPLLAVDYVELVDPRTLEPLTETSVEMLLLVAVRCGTTRLIDNATL